MNLAIISGKLQKPAKFKGSEKKALSFVVETTYQPTDGEKPTVTQVPCVLFTPLPEDLLKKLTSEGKGQRISLQGRVSSSRFEGENGEVTVRTEVLTFTNSVELG